MRLWACVMCVTINFCCAPFCGRLKLKTSCYYIVGISSVLCCVFWRTSFENWNFIRQFLTWHIPGHILSAFSVYSIDSSRNQANEKGKCSVIPDELSMECSWQNKRWKIKYPTKSAHLWEKNGQMNEKGMKTNRIVTTLLAPLEQAKCVLCKWLLD